MFGMAAKSDTSAILGILEAENKLTHGFGIGVRDHVDEQSAHISIASGE
jgi:hypothetical protein